MTPSELRRISFIVPVRNDAVGLDRCLRSIRANRLPSAAVELIVADNGSTDDSANVAGRHGAYVIVAEHVRVAELRNRAARHATGDVLAFVDADNEISSSWAMAAFESLRDDQVGATGAAYRSPENGTWVQRAYGRLRGRPRGTHDVDWLGSGNLAVPTRTFELVGGFNPTLEACEDVDLCNRIRGRGLRILSDARLASVHHGDPLTLWSLFRGELWRGRDNLRVSFRRPISWRAVLSAVIAVVDAIMIGMAVMGLIVALRAATSGLVLVGLAAAVITAVASLRAVRAVIRSGGAHPVMILQTFAVMWIYDVARAIALIARVPHRASRPTTPVIAS